MSEESIAFVSDGLKIVGNFALPSNRADGPLPAVVILHGFGSHMDAANVKLPAKMFNDLGYATLRFDMRGCGLSEGTPGRLICLEQVEDTRRAIDYLLQRAEIDPARIAVMGSSFGAAVAVYTTAVDPRVAAVISASGWGHGSRKFRGQHHEPGAYDRFVEMLAEAKRHKASTGTSMMIPRYEIVPIPNRLRGHVLERSIQMFDADTAQSMFDFEPENVVHQISPRPSLFLHSASDSVTPVEQSVAMWTKAGTPADLHLFAETDHFMFSEANERPRNVLADWLKSYFPATLKH
jgi:hypothetical protein